MQLVIWWESKWNRVNTVRHPSHCLQVGNYLLVRSNFFPHWDFVNMRLVSATRAKVSWQPRKQPRRLRLKNASLFAPLESNATTAQHPIYLGRWLHTQRKITFELICSHWKGAVNQSSWNARGWLQTVLYFLSSQYVGASFNRVTHTRLRKSTRTLVKGKVKIMQSALTNLQHGARREGLSMVGNNGGLQTRNQSRDHFRPSISTPREDSLRCSCEQGHFQMPA